MREQYWAQIIPPREESHPLEGASRLFAALSDSIELCRVEEGDRATWWVRAETPAMLDGAIRRIRTAHPAAELVGAGSVPGVVHAGEQGVLVTLRPGRDRIVGWEGRGYGPDDRSVADTIAAAIRDELGGLAQGSRIAERVTVQPADPREPQRLQGRIAQPQTGYGAAHEPVYDMVMSWAAWAAALIVFIPALLVVLVVLGHLEIDDVLGVAAIVARAAGVQGVLAIAVIVAGIALWWHFVRSLPKLPEEQVRAKLAHPLRVVSLSYLVIGPEYADPQDLRAVGYRVAEAVARMTGGALRAHDGGTVSPGGTARQSGHTMILNVHELAQIWHLPGARDGRSDFAGTRSQRIPPAPGQADHGVLVGHSDRDGHEIRLLPELLRRHHFVVGRTGRGKSTFVQHIASGILELMLTAGSGPMPLLVVIDPQGDLAEAVAERVPEPLRPHLHYLDVSEPGGFAINLIDARTVRNASQLVEQVIKIFHVQWAGSWGPRMDPALRIALLALYAANLKRADNEQYTILDVSNFLVDEQFRGDVLSVAGAELREEWRLFLELIRGNLRAEVTLPVTGKIARYRLNDRAHEIFGTPRSTLSLGETIESGGVLIVNMSTAALGEGATELIGAALLNLLAQTIDEQSARPRSERREVIGIVDEATLLATTDYARILTGLRASGGALVMATQSLAQLDTIDAKLRETILGNVDALTVFGVGAEDARRLQAELGAPISIEDVTDLDDYTAYARWWDGFGPGPAFSFRVLGPAGERAVSGIRFGPAQAVRPQPVPRPLKRKSWLKQLVARVRALLGL